MKKLYSLILVAAMLSMLAVSAFAAGETFVDADEYNDSAYGTLFWEVTGNEDDVAGYEGELGSTLYNLSSGGTSFCVKTDSYVWYEFDAPKNGTYTFACEYVARVGSDRAVNYVIDPKDPTNKDEQTLVNLAPCEDNDDHWYFIVTADLKAGKHTFYICCATGFDDSELKSCDFYGIKGYLTAEIVAEPTLITSGSPVTILCAGYKACGDNANEELQYGSEDPDVKTSIPLKPLDGENPEGAWFDFELNIPADGDLTLDFFYAAKNDRYMDVTLNGETKRVVCPDTENFQTFATTSVMFSNVPAGVQTLRLAAPSDYSDDVKTPNVESITCNFVEYVVETAAPETEAPAAAEPVATPVETAAPAVTSPAPAAAAPVAVAAPVASAVTTPVAAAQTGDAAAVAVLAAVAAIGCAVVIKKR